MITTLAIQLEAWLQEELAAQTRLAAVLEGLERAVRSGQTVGLAEAGVGLERELAGAPAREVRRRVLLGRIGGALALPPQAWNLTRLCARLSEENIETTRLAHLRGELRTTVAGVARVSRRLAAVARYHQGLLDELCQTLVADTGGTGGQLVDTRG